MGAAAGPLSLAATGLSAVGQYAKGRTAAADMRASGRESLISAFYSAQQMEAAAKAGEIKAAETARFMEDRTRGALANIDAVLALTGKDTANPTSFAVKNRFEYLSDEARTTAVGNIQRETQQRRNEEAHYMLSGMNALNAANANARKLDLFGLLSGAGSIFKAIPVS